jgi:hypothetical protein
VESVAVVDASPILLPRAPEEALEDHKADCKAPVKTKQEQKQVCKEETEEEKEVHGFQRRRLSLFIDV